MNDAELSSQGAQRSGIDPGRTALGTSTETQLAHVFWLSFELFRGALRVQQKRAFLGWLWLFLPAAAAALTATYIRSLGLLAFRTEMPYPAFVFAGTLLWQVFVEALNAPLSQLSNNRALITRVRFPHEALVLAGLWTVLLNGACRFAALLVLCWFVHAAIAPTALLIPVGVGLLALLGLGLGLLVAPIGLLYDDLGRALTILTSLIFFFMPVAYPISARGWEALNPVLPLINVSRSWLVGPAALDNVGLSLFTTCLLFLSWPFYRLAWPHIIERLG